MPTEKNVVRICDYERKSREPDALGPRDPTESATIILLPIVRIEPFQTKFWDEQLDEANGVLRR